MITFNNFPVILYLYYSYFKTTVCIMFQTFNTFTRCILVKLVIFWIEILYSTEKNINQLLS